MTDEEVERRGKELLEGSLRTLAALERTDRLIRNVGKMHLGYEVLL